MARRYIHHILKALFGHISSHILRKARLYAPRSGIVHEVLLYPSDCSDWLGWVGSYLGEAARWRFVRYFLR